LPQFDIAKDKMARTSPGVRRVAAILNFFADHPGQAFTLTDLVRALKLSRATCHALLMGLVEVGYLYRASDKNYVLGPALMNIARVAAEHASPAQAVLPEIRALADEFDASCSAFYRDRDDVVVLERASAGANVGWSAPPGARLKLRPPFGAIFYAWRPRAEAEAWLDASVPPPTPEQRADMLGGMQFARARGYVFGVQVHGYTGEQAPEAVFGGSQRELPVTIAAALERETTYMVAGLIAPVFDPRGEVAFVLSLTGVSGAAAGERVEHMGRRLREACDRITTFLGGRQPAPEAAPAA
jgi:DNA-binding IclR family transcriptional regulator